MNCCHAIQRAQNAKSNTTKSLLLQDWVFVLGFRDSFHRELSIRCANSDFSHFLPAVILCVISSELSIDIQSCIKSFRDPSVSQKDLRIICLLYLDPPKCKKLACFSLLSANATIFIPLIFIIGKNRA